MTLSDIQIDFSFEDPEYETMLAQLSSGDRLSAAALLAALDGESEDALQDVFTQLNDRGVFLDISDLTKSIGAGEAAQRLQKEAQLVQRGSLLTDLEETDPLRLYLEEIAAIPATGDIVLLAQELKEANCNGKEAEGLWSRILNLCLSRVFELACEHTGYGVLLLDLIQEGSMGLWSALASYTGDDFEAFRDWQIRQSLAQCITLQAYSNGVGQKMRRAMEDYRSVDERLLADLGRNPTLEEIAQQMHMGVEEAALVAAMLENARKISRAHLPEEEKEPDPEENQAVEDTAYFQMRQRISEMLSVLEPAQAEVLTLRFGLEGGLPLSSEDTARRLGLSTQQVLKMEAEALERLRKEG